MKKYTKRFIKLDNRNTPSQNLPFTIKPSKRINNLETLGDTSFAKNLRIQSKRKVRHDLSQLIDDEQLEVFKHKIQKDLRMPRLIKTTSN